MSYRENFYAVANIIGYTGVLQSFPTVYFQTAGERGHITQKHDTSQNVGRHEVESAVGYTLGNEVVEGQLRLVEKLNGQIFHTSRSTFTALAVNDNATRAILAQALRNCPGEKYISGYSNEIFDTMDAAAEVKAAFHILLAQRRPIQG